MKERTEAGLRMWCIPVIPVLRQLKEEKQAFGASLG